MYHLAPVAMLLVCLPPRASHQAVLLCELHGVHPWGVLREVPSGKGGVFHGLEEGQEEPIVEVDLRKGIEALTTLHTHAHYILHTTSVMTQYRRSFSSSPSTVYERRWRMAVSSPIVTGRLFRVQPVKWTYLLNRSNRKRERI